MQKALLMQIIRFLAVIASAAAIGLLFIYTFKFIYPILIAVLLSIMIHPFVAFLETKAKMPRFISIISVLSGCFLFLIGIVLLIVTELYQGTAFLAEQIPKHFHTFIMFLESFFITNLLPIYEKGISLFHSLDMDQQAAINGYIRSATDFVASTGADLLNSSLAKLPAMLGIVPGSLTTLTFILLATFMITNDLEHFKRTIKRLLPTGTTQSISALFSHFKIAVTGFFGAQLLLIVISGCIILGGLIIIQVDHALTIALIAAAVDLIPYVGTGLLFIPWILYTYATADFEMTIKIGILYMVVIVSRQILEPKILSSRIGIHPLIILIGVFIGMQVWGFAGLFIAPLLIVTGNALYQSGILQIIGKFIRG
ncbi:sporulation integral membrane protein YtvI [Oceanobacillus massiliensis]|uniref:sporulation integral membrane protein YtvI n=1 Tax=Oceanobacillus massiliensis TaxID=1465765 RepID=UPI000289826D|nr:sporulation integral membrane protein YtvI [Oceanobacillus massiliensis]